MPTGIEWTEETWNPVTGCAKVSQGCKHCYAETIAKRMWATQYPANADGSPRRFTDVRCHEDRLETPLKWRRPRRVFVNSMSDLFHEDVPDDFIHEVWSVMAQADQHTFQILTKRPERMARFAWTDVVGSPLPNVWLGVSVEDQATADERIPYLLQTPAAVRWLSCEPLLGPVDLRGPAPIWWQGNLNPLSGIDWVVVGGESGPKARPMNLDWARSLRDQCTEAGVPYFFKQMGGRGRKELWCEIPVDLAIREYPRLAPVHHVDVD